MGVARVTETLLLPDATGEPAVRSDERAAAYLAEVLEATHDRLVAEVAAATGRPASAQAAVDAAFVRAAALGERFLDVPRPAAWLRAAALRHDRLHLRHRGPGPPLDVTELRRRGARRRRRRAGLLAAATATALLVATGSAAAMLRGPGDTTDARLDRLAGSLPWPGSPSRLPIEAGTYGVVLSPYADVPRALVTVPDGWRAALGPTRSEGDESVDVVVGDVDQLVQRPCDDFDRGMVDVTDAPDDLVTGLQGLPGLAVAQPPAAERRFGWPATHLRLVTTEDVLCRWDAAFYVLDTDLGLLRAGPPGTTYDVWVVDVDGRAVLVSASATPGADAGLRDELDRVVDTVRVVPPLTRS